MSVIEDGKHAGCQRAFVHTGEAWYGKSSLCEGEVDVVHFGLYAVQDGGGTSGEMSVTWTLLGGKVVPQLTVFDDAWDALAQFSDLLSEMAKVDNQQVSAAQFCDMLRRCGFLDITERVAGERPWETQRA